ncbi:branched-chain amino acid ABC transporter permease [Desulfosporosinus sp.]|uniref:branched-chain amino acid ABC transporter permease n=1 Tax=Desulfosporosinus sp. TaxID=157907 RepID=UPI0025C39A5E|nr:branched-chain amino acid ABC transporter permease [Desulfosporosinus sp.]MBC2725940.1 branched-chain amino acid ABC transporter permease [Desulfosporosinus sp.]
MLKIKQLSQPRVLIFILSLIVLCTLPWVVSSFILRIATGIMMWIGLALSWNMLGGYMGYISFGHGASFGVGAYMTGLLMMLLHLPFFVALIISGVITYIFAMIVGYPTLRLSGSYFAIGTWAFAEMMRQLVLVLDTTGGPEGLRLPPMLNDNFFYFVMFGLALLVFLAAYFFFENSDFGLKVKAVREEEVAARTLGLNTTWIKNQVFALSSMFAGIIGGAFAYWITYIHPDSVLGPLIADQMVIMVLLGGIGTLFGPVIGAIVLYVGNQYMLAAWGQSSAYLIILGLAICLVILFLPEGLLSLPRVFKSTTKGAFARLLSPPKKTRI